MDRRILLAGGGLVLTGLGAGCLAMRDFGSMEAYNAAVAASRATLRQTPALKDFIRYATLAPSGHNTQPWKFRAHAAAVDILPDLSRRTSVVDPDDHHLFVALGCSAETLAIAAGAAGRPGHVAFDPANGDAVSVLLGNGASSGADLCDAITKRQSTRNVYDGKALSVTDVQVLAQAAAIPGVDLVLITDRAQIDRVRDLVITGNSAQMADPAFVRELKHWLRFSPRQALATSARQAGCRHFRRGSDRESSTGSSRQSRKTMHISASLPPRLGLRSSYPSWTTRRIGCWPAVPVNVSLCRRARRASNAPSSTG
ncbi:MAG TPA: hypothetical protein VMU82_11375 [Acetobacteraceae bacterium]|nr:hypothetical protein [Acetobacteraceae bacterium]